MDKYIQLAELIFGDIKQTIADLEKKYPKRALTPSAKVTRFAPSPTGFLHTGSLFAALISSTVARLSNGIFFIRLEDTDTKREIEGTGELLVKELAKFEVVPNEGYFGSYEKGEYGPYCQSQRAEIYKTVIKEMIIKGLAYPCFCSNDDLKELRDEQEKLKLRPGYYGKYAKCRNLTIDEMINKIKAGCPFILRFKSNGNFDNKIEVNDLVRGRLELSQNDQDIVILKSDGLPTYHFAHLVDDHFMHTNVVSRGEEWLPSLPTHLQLFEALGFEAPSYAHLPVIMKLDNGNKRKLSKRKDEEAAVSYFLTLGYPIHGFIEYLLTIANSNYEQWRSENMDKSFKDFELSFDKMSLDGALFDLAKVKNICKDRLSRMSKEEITQNTINWAKEYDEELLLIISRDKNYFMEIMNIEREKENPRKDYEKYSDIKNGVLFFYDDYYSQLSSQIQFNELRSKEEIKEILSKYSLDLHLDKLEEEWFEKIKLLASDCGFAANVKDYKNNKDKYKGHVGDVSEVIRIAITTKRQSQNLYYVLKVLGENKVRERINKVIASL